MKPIIFVHHSRLASAVFDLCEGDIHAAYSAPALSGDGKKGVSIFHHAGRLWTCGGNDYSPVRSSAHCYQLLLPENYKGADSVEYSYEGKTILYKNRSYRLGPRTEFRAADRAVSEWRAYLRRMYERGGHFTTGKTYHELLREDLKRQFWDVDVRAYRPHAGNMVLALNLELAAPDFDKHKSPPRSFPSGNQMELLPFALSPAWRKRLLPA